MTVEWSRINSGRAPSGDDLLEERPCPVCSGTDHALLSSRPEFQFFSDSSRPRRATLRNVRCATCGAAFLNPVYTERAFDEFFAEAGRSYGAAPQRASEQVRWLSNRELLQDRTLVLDVGCYEGDFLAHLPRGVRCAGVDIDAPAVERARKRLGDDSEVVVGDFARFEIAEAPDVIVMFHVLEHLPYPVPVLRRLRHLASEGSRLVVEIPIAERGCTSDLVGFFSPQHTTHFTRGSAANVVRQAGWRILETFEPDGYNGYRLLMAPGPEQQAVPHVEDAVLLDRALRSQVDAAARIDKRLRTLAEAAKCIIWGAGMHTEHLYALTRFFRSRSSRTYALIDGDPLKQGRTWRGVRIHHPHAAATEDVPVIVSSYGSTDEIAGTAGAAGIALDRLVLLYEDSHSY